MQRWKAIAQRATELLGEFETSRGCGAFVSGGNAATVIDRIAQECLGLEVIEWPHLDPGVLGELDLEDGTVCIRPGLEPGRRAFTVSHEIGHAALGHAPRILGHERRVVDLEASVNERVNPDELEVQNGVYRAYNSRDALEAEANLFAAELLAPTSLVLELVETVPDWTPESLAERFGTSLTAIMTQLANTLLRGRGDEDGSTDVDDDEPSSVPSLDEPQKEAVTVEAPALVIAGPGAGKTRVLAERYAHLIRSGASQESVLALTFSNKAAEEMRGRVAGMVGSARTRVQAYTFHSFCLETLKGYYHLAGLPERFTILTEADALLLIRRRLSELDLSHLEQLSDPGFYVPGVLDAISRAKDELRGPEEFETLARECADAAETEEEREDTGKTLEAAKIYSAYQGWLRDSGSVDFGDLVRLTVEVLEHLEVGEEIGGQYGHVLVDEFQDINFASGRLLNALDGGRGVVWAVADPDQSIYRFRGASPVNLDRFHDDYSGTRTVHLMHNHRSGPDIVGACHGLRGGADPERDARPAPAPLEATREAPEAPTVSLTVTEDERSELDFIAEGIRVRAERGVSLGDQAVLCPTNAKARAVVSRLQEASVAAQGTSSILASDEIKDTLAVVSLLRGNDGSGLFKIAASEHSPVTEKEIADLLAWTSEQEMNIREALARCSEVDSFSAEAAQYLGRLQKILEDLPAWGDPWLAILGYAFHPDSRVRALLLDACEDSNPRLEHLGQLASLASTFREREELVEGNGIQGFIQYVQELASSKKGDAGLQPPPVNDAVQVLTVHKSKGLEFPVVYVPNLASGRFPGHAPGGGNIPLPDGLLHHSEATDREDEDRCLLYVALTRAEDELILSRAERYGKTAPKQLTLLDRLVREKDGRTMVSESRYEPDEDGSGAKQPYVDRVPEVSDTHEPVAYGLRQLEDFGECPLKYKFGAVLGLRDGGSAYLDFRRSVYRVLGDMEVEAKQSGANPKLQWARQRLEEVWRDEGPVGHFYEPVYLRRADTVVERWHASESAVDWGVREELSLSLAEGARITVKTDAMSRNEDGTLIIARHNFGRPRKSHANSQNKDALSVAAAKEIWPEIPVRVELQYPATGEATDITPTPRVISNRTRKLTGFLEEARSGRYPANPGHACKECPWNLICPSSV